MQRRFYQLRGLSAQTSLHNTIYISSQHVLLNTHINNLDAQSICQICLVLFGYKVNIVPLL